MKILLIYPPFYRFMGYYNRYFPYGLLTLATAVKNNGYEVSLYDADFHDKPIDIDISTLSDKYDYYLRSFNEKKNNIWNEVKNTIESYQPDIVGLQVFTDFVASAYNIAKMSKQINPKCRVVMGGPHISVKADEVMSTCPEVDYLVIGEGEKTFIELIDYFEKGIIKINEVDGIVHRDGNKIKTNNTRMVEKNLDGVPLPDRSLLINEKRYTSEDMGLIMTSRGCPFECAFCVTERNTRYGSVDRIIEEIKSVKKRYGTKQFTIKDDSFTVNKKRVKEFCEKLILSNIKIVWECNTRVDLINESLLKLMKKAGCIFIKVGIETGSEKILKKMNKKVTFDQMIEAARLFRKIGIHWTGYFIIGVPGETREDIEKTLSFMYKLKPDFAYVAVYQPYPGCKMFDEGISRNLVKKEMSKDDFFKLSPNQYYKKDPQIQLDTISKEEFSIIEADVKLAFHKYNKNFFRLVKMAFAKRSVYLSDLRLLYMDFKKYLSY